MRSEFTGKKQLQNNLKVNSAAGPCAEYLPAWGLLNKSRVETKAQYQISGETLLFSSLSIAAADPGVLFSLLS